ncbi:MAG: hypothetical protein ABJ205_09695 [Erythrobacter sp.]|uniref:hypothetical protein n=1 Tax=Erythrobacter sp. TaxID=1042 RepID=UPI0032634E5A
MTAALALLILLAGSLVIVRIASVVLRLTGLPDHVARFQSISALTGAGFTTTESEAIVNFPIRRKVVVALMVLGNLGLVSVASTIIVALADSVGDTDRLLLQVAQMAATIAVIALFMLSKTLDRLLCGAAARVLRYFMSAKVEHFDVLLALGPDHCVAAHVYRGRNDISAYDLLGDLRSISIMAVMGLEHRLGDIDQHETRIGPNETVICFASVADHRSFSEKIIALA